MFKTSKKMMLLGLIIAAISTSLLTAMVASAGDIELMTAKGEIISMDEGVIELNGNRIFYPAMEIDIPVWAVVGAEVAMSYSIKDQENRYLEIVRPGEKFEVKEELEKLHRELK